MRRLFITIDTEMDADKKWKKKSPVTFSSVVEAIPALYRPIWDKYEICPIYFVSPEVVNDKECCEILKSELSKGAVIGAHLHPEYIEPNMGIIGKIDIEEFPCYGYDKEIEKEKIKNLKNLIKNNLGVDVTWYRAARFGADIDTIASLDELGFRYDSSFTPGIDWSSKGGPDHSLSSIEPFNFPGTGITEYPVTIIGKRFGILGKIIPDNWLMFRWLRPTHMTYLEEKHLIDLAVKRNISNIVMMFHSMEVMINKSPYVRNRIMQRYYLWRLRKTIEYAKKNGYASYKTDDEIQ